MKIVKESVNIDSIKVGDMIIYDSNYIGVTPKIHKGEVIRIEKGIGSKGDPIPSKIFVVKNDLGKVVKVDEYAVEDILVENNIIKTESLSQIEKDLKDILGFKRGFKDHNSLNKFINSRGYEVVDYDTDYGNHYIDIAGIGDKYDGYRYSFDLDYSSEAPGGRLSIGTFIDRDKE